jgi:hypothetical protein
LKFPKSRYLITQNMVLNVLMLMGMLLDLGRQTMEELAVSGIHALYNGGSCTVVPSTLGAATEQIGLALKLWTCTHDMPGSRLRQDTSYPD